MPVLSAFELAVSLFYIRRLLFLFPCFTFAQATSTESAIAELRQLLADQRSALDRPAQIIEVQERRLAAVERRDAGLPDGDCSRGGRSSGYCAAAANKNYSCGARPGSSNHGCLGRRLSGFDPHSRHRIIRQTRRSGANGRRSHVAFMDIVVEVLAGARTNKNGQRATSSQVQTGWTLRF